jgi:hypothetical protein
VSKALPAADDDRVTTQGTTEDLASAAEETVAGAALAAGLAAVADLHDDAMALISHLAETWDHPAAADEQGDGVRVLRMADRPTVGQRIETAAA